MKRRSEFASISGRLRRAAPALASAGLAAVIGLWYFAFRTPAVPRRTLRIGFENIPPVQMITEGGPTGIAVETINEAARRSGISLQWIQTGTSSEQAFRRGLVDLWPLMVDLPDRRKWIHITLPWLHTNHTLVLAPEPDASGPRFCRPAGNLQVAGPQPYRPRAISGSSNRPIPRHSRHHQGGLYRYGRCRLHGTSRRAGRVSRKTAGMHLHGASRRPRSRSRQSSSG